MRLFPMLLRALGDIDWHMALDRALVRAEGLSLSHFPILSWLKEIGLGRRKSKYREDD